MSNQVLGRWLAVFALSALGRAAMAAPINQPTSALAGADHVLVDFDTDGEGVPLASRVGGPDPADRCNNIAGGGLSCFFPANEYAAFGVTFNPTTRITRDTSINTRNAVAEGGSGPNGLVAASTAEIIFAPPVEAFEFWIVSVKSGNPISDLRFTAFDGNDVEIESVTFAGTPVNLGFSAHKGFCGISSETPIHRVTVASPFGILDQLRFVGISEEVIDLTLATECSEDPDISRGWRITNTNDFDVDVRWEVDGTAQTDTITAAPGDTYFETATDPLVDNTVSIYWLDEFQDEQSTSAASGGVACDDDDDGLPNKDEPAYGTDPNNPDTDGDGLLDGEEAGQAMDTGCPDPASSDSDGDGLDDGVDNNICNAPPSASIVVEQLTGIGSTASVRFDGLGSSDDDPISELQYTWTLDGNVVCDGDSSTCSTIELQLAYGDHDVTLVVTDTDGDFGMATTFVTIDPAQLSVFEIGDATVRFNPNQRRATLTGEIGLPFGVNYSELDPEMTFALDLAGINVLPATTIGLSDQGLLNQRWRYQNSAGPIRDVDVDWTGSYFIYLDGGFPILLNSLIISTDETVLMMTYDRRKIGNGFTMDVDGLASIQVASNGTVSGNVPVLNVIPRIIVLITLPFPLTDASVIDFSGLDNRDIDVGNYLQASVGRYRAQIDFDPNLIPDGVNNPNPSIDLMVTVGEENYYSGAGLGSGELCVNGNQWVDCD